MVESLFGCFPGWTRSAEVERGAFVQDRQSRFKQSYDARMYRSDMSHSTKGHSRRLYYVPDGSAARMRTDKSMGIVV